ncbi:hypothetical protein [Rosenbergiella epipactidis]|uniref:hypothetical protein n=1 Tax=Rosenbergiella epipactidis TaxID=1544694 RepID=UPI001F4E8467|nr:hypothetical protein [Rosenbergiella epipactidis]
MENKEQRRFPEWERYLSIHEAGHALLAYLWGSRSIEIGIADENRTIVFSGDNEHNDCKAACLYDLYHDDGLTPDPKAMLSVMIAGAAAESVYTGLSIDHLMTKTAKSDSEKIAKSLELIQKRACGRPDHSKWIYLRSLSLCKSIINIYWRDIEALADLVEQKRMTPHPEIINFFESRESLKEARIYQLIDTIDRGEAA